MRPFVLTLLMTAALGATACGGSTTGPSSPIDTRVTVPLGQSVEVAGAGASLRFDAVEDSRCPGDAMCITQGFALTRLTVVADGRERQVSLRTDPPASRTANVSGFTLELVQVDPYPFLSRPNPPPAEATVRIRR